MKRQPGLFDMEERLRRLSDIGDQLEAFTAVVNFERFPPGTWPRRSAMAMGRRAGGRRSIR